MCWVKKHVRQAVKILQFIILRDKRTKIVSRTEALQPSDSNMKPSIVRSILANGSLELIPGEEKCPILHKCCSITVSINIRRWNKTTFSALLLTSAGSRSTVLFLWPAWSFQLCFYPVSAGSDPVPSPLGKELHRKYVGSFNLIQPDLWMESSRSPPPNLLSHFWQTAFGNFVCVKAYNN